MTRPAFKLYSYVEKKTGYKYPGMVVGIFMTRANQIRYVVEAIHPDFQGMCHIFSEEQLESTIQKKMNELSIVEKGERE
jgi:hypothetical protein